MVYEVVEGNPDFREGELVRLAGPAPFGGKGGKVVEKEPRGLLDRLRGREYYQVRIRGEAGPETVLVEERGLKKLNPKEGDMANPEYGFELDNPDVDAFGWEIPTAVSEMGLNPGDQVNPADADLDVYLLADDLEGDDWDEDAAGEAEGLLLLALVGAGLWWLWQQRQPSDISGNPNPGRFPIALQARWRPDPGAASGGLHYRHAIRLPYDPGI